VPSTGRLATLGLRNHFKSGRRILSQQSSAEKFSSVVKTFIGMISLPLSPQG
jgi:hypothetical protein